MKLTLDYFKDCTFSGKLWIIKTFLDLPAAIFHELTHIIIAIITCTFKRVYCKHFYDIFEEKDEFIAYEFVVETQAEKNNFGHIRCMLVNISPLLGYCCLIFIFPNFWLLIYCIFSYNMFIMSKTDVKNFLYHIKELIK